MHVRPGLLGLVLEAGAVGGVLGSVVTKRLGPRIGIGWAYVLGCLVSPRRYGTRPVAALAGGALGTLLGLRPALWIGAAGAIMGVLWPLRSPPPAFRMPAPGSGAGG